MYFKLVSIFNCNIYSLLLLHTFLEKAIKAGVNSQKDIDLAKMEISKIKNPELKKCKETSET